MLINMGQIVSSANQALRNAIGLNKASPQEMFTAAIFANGPALPQVSSDLSGHSMGSSYIISDYTSLYRATQDLAVGIWSEFPGSPLSWMKHFIGSKDIALGYHAFGSASSINTIIGLIAMKKNFKAIAYSDAIGDSRGSLLGRVSLGKDAFLTGAGISFGAYRPFSMIQVIKDASSTSLLGRLSSGFVIAGLAFYAVFFFLLSGILGIQLYEGLKIEGKLNEAEELLGKVEVLQKRLEVDPNRVYEKLIEKHGTAKAKEMLIDEALDAGVAGLQTLMEDLELDQVPEDSLKTIVKQAIASGCNGWTLKSAQTQVEQKLEQVGLEMKVEKAQIKHVGKLQRWLGQTGLEAVKELSSLAGRVKLGDKDAIEEAETLVKVIQSSARGKITENAIVMAILVMGTVAMVAAIAFTTGIPLVAASALMLVFSVLMMMVDGYYLLESYRGERPAVHDKKMIIVSTIVGVASLLALIGLGVSGVVTMGVFPIVIGALLSLLWIGQNGVTWFVMNRNEKKFHEKHPTLESFLEALEDGNHKERIMKCFANLPPELKVKIQDELKNHGNDMRGSTLAVIEKVERAKNAQMEILRQSLTQYLVSESIA